MHEVLFVTASWRYGEVMRLPADYPPRQTALLLVEEADSKALIFSVMARLAHDDICWTAVQGD